MQPRQGRMATSELSRSTGQQFPTDLIDCVEQAVTATFACACGIEPACRGTSVDVAGHESVVGIISVVGGDLAWSLMLCLPRNTAVALAEKFAGFEIPFDSADMGDVVGELANILAGDVVARLDGLGHKADLSLSLPTVVRGGDMELLLPHELWFVRMGFASPDGEFWLELAAAEARK